MPPTGGACVPRHARGSAPRASLDAVRSLAFLLSRRWILLALAVVLLSTLAWQLGQWQFRRLEDRQERNATTLRNESAEPVPVTDVLAEDRPVAAEDEWRLVTATGEYATDDTVVVRYRTRDGESGVDVVVPLVLPGGTAVLVDRGWLLSDNNATVTPDVPSPPPGPVTVTGWVRADAEGDCDAGRRPEHPRHLQRGHRRGTRPLPPRRLPGPDVGGPRALDAPARGRACPTSATARTSSTGSSGGSSRCWPSAATSTSRSTSGGVDGTRRGCD